MEILAGVSDKFAIGGVVDSLDACNLGAQCGHMALDMLDELGLRTCRSRDEYGSCVGDGLRYPLKEFVILGGVAAANCVGLVVDMKGWVVGTEYEAIDLRHVEMKDAGFVVVDPDDRVKVGGHMGFLSRTAGGVAVSVELA